MKPTMDAERKEQLKAENAQLEARMAQIGQKILVLSGKGGVGKSTVAANLAVSLADRGLRVGLLDVDVHGPSIPQLLGLRERPAAVPGMTDDGGALLSPVTVGENLRALSMGSLLEDRSAAVVWRGPMKYNVIKQFLKDVEWGALDVLVVDSPPGTGDEPLSVAQLIPDPTGAVVVTTPQDLSVADVRRCVTFCRQLDLPILGLVENMSGFVCPCCNAVTDVFGSGGGERLGAELGIPFLGRIPIEAGVVSASDRGTPFVQASPETPAAQAFAEVCRRLLSEIRPDEEDAGDETDTVKIAVPVAEGTLALHFGHCEAFAFVEADRATREVRAVETQPAPDHQPGLLPRWLAERGAQVVLAGGMGQRAQALFREQGIEVVTGAPAAAPEVLAEQYLNDDLETGVNLCDH